MPRHPAVSGAARALPRSVFDRLWPRALASGRPLAPLHLGDTYLPPPLAARLGALGFGAGAETDLYRYAPAAGWPPLLDAIVAKVRADNGLAWCTRDHVQVTAGATHALAVALRAVADPGDELLILSPFWPLIRGIARASGVVAVEVPLARTPGDDLGARLAPFITPRTTAIYLATPNNPDGAVHAAAALAALADVARRHDLWVLADEVYEHHLFDGRRHASIAALPGMEARTCSVYSCSKSYGLAGLRVGYVVAPPDVAATCRALTMHSIYSVPRAMQAAALAAIEHGDAFVRDAGAVYQALRDRVADRLVVPCERPDGATYLFLDLGRWVEGGEPSAIGLLERLADAGVLLAPGELFGAAWPRHARLCYSAVPADRLDDAVDRINRVLEG